MFEAQSPHKESLCVSEILISVRRQNRRRRLAPHPGVTWQVSANGQVVVGHVRRQEVGVSELAPARHSLCGPRVEHGVTLLQDHLRATKQYR